MSKSEGTHYTLVNRHAWDLRTQVHLNSSFYNLEAFKRGELSLKPPELELVGNVQGQSLLHLQCHFGLDTLSWERLGARVTGVDLSLVSIQAAQHLAEEIGVHAIFICGDVQDLEKLGEPFDLAVTSYGVLCWLSDLYAWAKGIRRNLKQGGRLVLVEYHPLLEVFYCGKISGTQSYFGIPNLEKCWSRGTYTNPQAPISYWEYRWQHPISNVIEALIGAGFMLSTFREYPYCSYRLLDELDTYEEGVWKPSISLGRLPYMYSIVATAHSTPYEVKL